jgi:hypothetical protein
MIKASHILESITNVLVLNERNIYNVQEIENWIETFLRFRHLRGNPADNEIKSWLRTVVRNYLLNDYPHLTLITSGNDWQNIAHLDMKKAWVRQAIDRKDLYNVILANPYILEFQVDLAHVVDYFQYVLDFYDRLPRNLQLRSFDRVSLKDAIQKSKAWTEWLNKQETGGWEEGEERVMKTSDGFVVMQLTSEAALNREGKVMQHCVGSYARLVENEDVIIYSLRDSSNNPHVTIEVDNSRKVQQIKGKQNDAPVEKYHGAVIEFLNWLEPKDIEELENVRGVRYDGEIYHENDLPAEYWESPVGREDFCDAVRWEDEKKVAAILKSGANPNVKNIAGDFPLFISVERNLDIGIAELLLKNPKIDVNLQDKYGFTTLMRLCVIDHRSDPVILKELLSRSDLDPNLQQTSQGASALSMAASHNLSENIKLLLKYPKTDPNIQSNDGRTPLIVAVNFECVDAVEELLKDKRVNIDIKDNGGKTVIDHLREHYANIDKNREMWDLFEKYRGVKQDYLGFLMGTSK